MQESCPAVVYNVMNDLASYFVPFKLFSVQPHKYVGDLQIHVTIKLGYYYNYSVAACMDILIELIKTQVAVSSILQLYS